MSTPDRLVWGGVPDEKQRDDLRRSIAEVIYNAKPPMPDAYAIDLLTAIMAEVESWDWWKYRWYGVWDDDG